VEGIPVLKNPLSFSLEDTWRVWWPVCQAFYHKARQSDFCLKVAETLGTRILLIGTGLVTTVIVARILGPEGRGLYAVATTVAGIGVQFGNLGLHASNTYFVSRDRQYLPRLLSFSLLVSFGFGSLIVALTYALFAGWPRLGPVSGPCLIIALVWVPFGLAYLLMQNLLLGLRRVRDFNKIELASRAAGVLLILLLAAGKWLTVETALLAALATVILASGWNLREFRHCFGQLAIPAYSFLKEQFHYGLKAYSAALLGFLVFRINLLMIKFMLNTEQAGYYSIASIMAETIYVLPGVTGMILFPKLAALKTLTEKWQFTQKVALGLGLFMLVFMIGVALLARPAIRLAFGAAYLPALLPFFWLLPGIFLYSLNTCYMNFFAAIGMPLVTSYSPGLALMVNFLLNLLLIPSWGIVGASISTAAASLCMLVASLIYIARLRIPRDDGHSFL
jgi:O-antigen/teichoic acid export membrane protein